ncbi:MAG: AMP-binding protein [Gammaproteobacteria bacterium]
MIAIEPTESRDLPTVLTNRVGYCPDKPWIITAGRGYSYREMDDLSGRLARGMQNAGIANGDTVLIMMPDTVDFILAWCALSKFGGIEVPVNVHNRGNPFAYLINDSLARTMIIDVGFLERLEAVKDELNLLERIVLYDQHDSRAAFAESRLAERLGSRFEIRHFADLFAEQAYTGPGPVYRDLMAVMYTSGTTGPSKGVTTSHAHAFEYAYGIIEMLELEEDDIYCAPLPLFHIAGQFATIYASCIAGASAVISGPFSVERFWQNISNYRVTCTFLLGAMANFVYRQPVSADDADNPLERALVVPLIPEVEDFKRRFGCLVSTTWGGTEMNCPTRSGFDLANNKTCGRVAEDRYEVRIVDEYDREVADGVPGEALVRPKVPWIMSNGYWQHPEWTEKAWRNLWHHTGDMLMRDADGNLYFVDRVKDAIRRRGENISSMEVENEINSHPAVLECAVIPVSAEETEEEVMAVLVARDGDRVDPEELIRYLEPRMAYFMIPRYIEIVDALPKTATGKIQKFELRQAGVSERTWDRVAAGVKLER